MRCGHAARCGRRKKSPAVSLRMSISHGAVRRVQVGRCAAAAPDRCAALRGAAFAFDPIRQGDVTCRNPDTAG
ncbi:hypothetical protein C6P92_20950 [Burkholderia multivorans]|nr:hypothetical protein C6P92_20950 [Burkholderia multivorans]PRG37587.1 hypothetical protein C6T62_15255 [Burkholderia multivorans]